MKIFIANDSQQKIGGGFSWINTFKKGMRDQITDNYEEADIYLVAGASMIKPEPAEKAKADGKKVVLRVDNFLKHSRNQGKGMERMRRIGEVSDLVVYQSRWARDFLSGYIGKQGVVINNGVDTNLFNSNNRVKRDYPVFLYSRFNRDDSKNWVVAQYMFMEESRKNPDAELWIVGQFSRELIEYNLDFYNGEHFKFWGVQPPEQMSNLYKQADYFLYTYFADACSNSLIEALASGCKVPDYCSYYLGTGGAPDIMNMEDYSLERMCRDYKQALEEI